MSQRQDPTQRQIEEQDQFFRERRARMETAEALDDEFQHEELDRDDIVIRDGRPQVREDVLEREREAREREARRRAERERQRAIAEAQDERAEFADELTDEHDIDPGEEHVEAFVEGDITPEEFIDPIEDRLQERQLDESVEAFAEDIEDQHGVAVDPDDDVVVQATDEGFTFELTGEPAEHITAEQVHEDFVRRRAEEHLGAVDDETVQELAEDPEQFHRVTGVPFPEITADDIEETDEGVEFTDEFRAEVAAQQIDPHLPEHDVTADDLVETEEGFEVDDTVFEQIEREQRAELAERFEAETGVDIDPQQEIIVREDRLTVDPGVQVPVETVDTEVSDPQVMMGAGPEFFDAVAEAELERRQEAAQIDAVGEDMRVMHDAIQAHQFDAQQQFERQMEQVTAELDEQFDADIDRDDVIWTGETIELNPDVETEIVAEEAGVDEGDITVDEDTGEIVVTERETVVDHQRGPEGIPGRALEAFGVAAPLVTTDAAEEAGDIMDEVETGVREWERERLAAGERLHDAIADAPTRLPDVVDDIRDRADDVMAADIDPVGRFEEHEDLDPPQLQDLALGAPGVGQVGRGVQVGRQISQREILGGGALLGGGLAAGQLADRIDELETPEIPIPEDGVIRDTPEVTLPEDPTAVTDGEVPVTDRDLTEIPVVDQVTDRTEIPIPAEDPTDMALQAAQQAVVIEELEEEQDEDIIDPTAPLIDEVTNGDLINGQREDIERFEPFEGEFVDREIPLAEEVTEERAFEPTREELFDDIAGETAEMIEDAGQTVATEHTELFEQPTIRPDEFMAPMVDLGPELDDRIAEDTLALVDGVPDTDIGVDLDGMLDTEFTTDFPALDTAPAIDTALETDIGLDTTVDGILDTLALETPAVTETTALETPSVTEPVTAEPTITEVVTTTTPITTPTVTIPRIPIDPDADPAERARDRRGRFREEFIFDIDVDPLGGFDP